MGTDELDTVTEGVQELVTQKAEEERAASGHDAGKEAAADKGQQALPTITGTWPANEGGARTQTTFQEMMADVKAGMGIHQIRHKHAEANCLARTNPATWAAS